MGRGSKVAGTQGRKCPSAWLRSQRCHLGDMPSLLIKTCVGASECKDTGMGASLT